MDRTLFPLQESSENDKSKKEFHGKPRLKSPVRNQIEIITKSLDDLLPKDHIVRSIWKYVEGLDLSILLKEIKSVEGNAGRSATDPKILLALWLYATIKGIGSARLIEEYCNMHDAFKWICGGVKVNNHTISDFRSFQGDLLDNLLTQSVAILANNEIISLEAVSQDGMRVRACAGKSSFRREETLQSHLLLANFLVEDLKKEAEKDPGSCRKRIEASQRRQAEEKQQNIQKALKELEKIRKSKIRGGKKELHQVDQNIIENSRASTTDPESRIMQMADGGYRPAYNVQFATTNIGKGIIGVSITNSPTDQKQTFEMLKQVQKRYGIIPKKWLQDCGYDNCEEFDKVVKAYKKCMIYMPVRKTKKGEYNLHERQPKDTDERAEWRERMGTDEAKKIYNERSQTAEFANAQARNRGMQRFLIRGLEKVQNVALIFAIVHNMVTAFSN